MPGYARRGCGVNAGEGLYRGGAIEVSGSSGEDDSSRDIRGVTVEGSGYIGGVTVEGSGYTGGVVI